MTVSCYALRCPQAALESARGVVFEALPIAMGGGVIGARCSMLLLAAEGSARPRDSI